MEQKTAQAIANLIKQAIENLGFGNSHVSYVTSTHDTYTDYLYSVTYLGEKFYICSITDWKSFGIDRDLAYFKNHFGEYISNLYSKLVSHKIKCEANELVYNHPLFK